MAAGGPAQPYVDYMKPYIDKMANQLGPYGSGQRVGAGGFGPGFGAPMGRGAGFGPNGPMGVSGTSDPGVAFAPSGSNIARLRLSNPYMNNILNYRGGQSPATQGSAGQFTPTTTAGPGLTPTGINGMGPSSGAPQGVTPSMFGQNPYSTDVPLSNTFTAQTPTSNINFNPNQYAAGTGEAAGNISTLGKMLMSQAQGGGPNLAEEQLKSATNRNIAQAYALGQSQPNNPASARNIANNVAAANQQAAADSAQVRMQQQLAAQGQLSQLGLGMFGTSGRLMTDAEKMQLEQAMANQQAALNAQGINAQTSANNQAYGANVIGAGIDAGGAGLKMGIDAFGDYLKNRGSSSGGGYGPGGYWSASDQTPATPMPDTQGWYGQGDFGSDTGGGFPDTSYGARGGLMTHRGLMHFAAGGDVSPYAPNANPADFTDYSGKSEVSDPSVKAFLSPPPRIPAYQPLGRKTDGTNGMRVVGDVAHLNPYTGAAWDIGSMVFAPGGLVPGHAQEAGNSLKNDKVKAMLSPGEIVLPRSVTQGPDAADKAKEFVEAIMRRKKKAA